MAKEISVLSISFLVLFMVAISTNTTLQDCFYWCKVKCINTTTKDIEDVIYCCGKTLQVKSKTCEELDRIDPENHPPEEKPNKTPTEAEEGKNNTSTKEEHNKTTNTGSSITIINTPTVIHIYHCDGAETNSTEDDGSSKKENKTDVKPKNPDAE